MGQPHLHTRNAKHPSSAIERARVPPLSEENLL